MSMRDWPLRRGRRSRGAGLARATTAREKKSESRPCSRDYGTREEVGERAITLASRHGEGASRRATQRGNRMGGRRRIMRGSFVHEWEGGNGSRRRRRRH